MIGRYNCFSNDVNYLRTNATVFHTEAQLNGVPGWTSNIVADPLLVDLASGDLRLQPGSPCIDRGTKTSTLGIDYYGNRRVAGKACDIGGYEYSPPPGGTVVLIR